MKAAGQYIARRKSGKRILLRRYYNATLTYRLPVNVLIGVFELLSENRQ